MDLEAQINALLQGELDITTLTADERRTLLTGLSDETNSIDPADTDDDGLARLEQLIGLTEQVAEAVAADVNAAGRAARVDELRRRREQIPTPPEPPAAAAADPEPEQGDDPDSDPGDPEPAAPEPDTAPVRRVQPIAASTSRPSMAQLAAQTRPAVTVAAPGPRRIAANAALTAAANLPGVETGAVVDWHALGKATADQLRRLRSSQTSEVYNTASITWEYPPDRQLGDGDSTEQINSALSVRATMESLEEQGGIGALVASGGICGPPEVFYDLQVDSVADRPLRASLPSFQPKRGGINFNVSPTFASVGTSATAIWTAANDANPTAPTTKPVQTFNCPSPVQEYVYGIPTRWQFSNFQERYSPEWVAANTQLALANAARVAEIQLWSKIASGTYSTRIGASALVSFTRDLMALLELQVNAYRYRHRLPESFPMRAIFPFWVKGAFRTDFLRQTATQDPDWLRIADAFIASLFAARGVIPTYVMDGLPKSTAGTTLGTNAWDYPDQFFAAPTDGAALGTPPADASAGSASAGTWWPSRLAFSLFAEGTWLFLDGGRIDLGVVRDTKMNDTNQYQEFVEPIEGLAKRGYESQLLVVPIKPTGQSIGTITAPASLPY